MTRKPSLANRVRYKLDLAFSKGPLVVIGYLGLLMLAVILVATVLLWVFGLSGVNGDTKGLSVGESFWQSLLRVLDSGTFASDKGWSTRIVSLLVTLSGIFIAGSLIGLIASAVDQKIEDLRKGRSTVIEHGHTLVLGWSARLPVILSERRLRGVVEHAQGRHGRRAPGQGARHRHHHDQVLDARRVTRPAHDPRANAIGARSIIVLAGDDGDAGAVKCRARDAQHRSDVRASPCRGRARFGPSPTAG